MEMNKMSNLGHSVVFWVDTAFTFEDTFKCKSVAMSLLSRPCGGLPLLGMGWTASQCVCLRSPIEVLASQLSLQFKSTVGN